MSVLLKGYELYDWSWNSRLSKDDNFMDLCMIITRSSKLKQGSMACLLVDEAIEVKDLSPEEDLCKDIISVANNRSLYDDSHSDIHAEIAAIGEACRRGISTDNATAYITMVRN